MSTTRGVPIPEQHVQWPLGEIVHFMRLRTVEGLAVSDTQSSPAFSDEKAYHVFLGAPLLCMGNTVGMLTVLSQAFGVYYKEKSGGSKPPSSCSQKWSPLTSSTGVSSRANATLVMICRCTSSLLSQMRVPTRAESGGSKGGRTIISINRWNVDLVHDEWFIECAPRPCRPNEPRASYHEGEGNRKGGRRLGGTSRAERPMVTTAGHVGL